MLIRILVVQLYPIILGMAKGLLHISSALFTSFREARHTWQAFDASFLPKERNVLSMDVQLFP
jgi:hypothetical protein